MKLKSWLSQVGGKIEHVIPIKEKIMLHVQSELFKPVVKIEAKVKILKILRKEEKKRKKGSYGEFPATGTRT